MQSFPIPYFPGGSVPRNAAPGRRGAPRKAPSRQAPVFQPGPTLVFSGVALMILGTATMLATCIASFG
jgi:hypothetical protein